MTESAPAESGIRYIDDVMVFEPPSELFDRLEIANISDAWLNMIEEDRPNRVVVSFDRVNFFGSEAIGVVIRMSKRIREYGGDIRLCSMGKDIRDIFDVCQLIPTLFEVSDSTADAIASFK